MQREDMSRFLPPDLSEESVDKLEAILKKEGKNFTHDEARKFGQDLIQFYTLLADGYEEFEANQERLKREPEGWIVENHHDNWYCNVCGGHYDQLWYEQEGFRCQKCKDKGKTVANSRKRQPRFEIKSSHDEIVFPKPKP